MIIEDYKNHLLINGKSEATIRNYSDKIKIFLDYTSLDNITEEIIAKFLLTIKENNKASTVNIYRSAIISFLKFIKKEIKVPNKLKIDKKIPEYFTEEYFKKEIIPVVDLVCKKPTKMKALFYFMYKTGIRVGEFKDLKRKHINLETREVKIYVKKRNEERIVFIDEETRDILKAYFLDEPETFNAFNISVKTIKWHFHQMKPYFKDINFHPHLFRHSFANLFTKMGISDSKLQQALGHKSILSTGVYSQLNTKDRKQIYDKVMSKRKRRK
jgi:integrase/recombinase XerD